MSDLPDDDEPVTRYPAKRGRIAPGSVLDDARNILDATREALSTATALSLPPAPASKKAQLDLAAFRGAALEFFAEAAIKFWAKDNVESVTALWKAITETGRPDAAFSKRLHEFYTTPWNMKLHGSGLTFPYQPTFAQLRAGLCPFLPGARSAAERKRERELVRHHLALCSSYGDDPPLAEPNDLDFIAQTDQDFVQLLEAARETLRPLLRRLRKLDAWENVAYFGYYLSDPTLFYEGIQGMIDTDRATKAVWFWSPAIGHEAAARHLAQMAMHEALNSGSAERLVDVFWAYYWAAVFERRRAALNLPVV